MGWRQVGKRRYFYRSQKRDGRPVRLYVGTGAAAELAAAAQDLRRLERAVAARERLADKARREEAEASLLELCAATDVLARAALAAGGFFRHDRGKWRRRREQGSNK